MENKNVSFKHTLEEYNKKYRNRKYRLLKLTKKEVEDFDKKNHTVIKNFLLKDRKWWFIGDTYYEIPTAPRYVWFRNLNAGIQVATSALGVAIIGGGIAAPIIINMNKGDVVDPIGRDISIDSEVQYAKCESKMVDGNLEVTLSATDNKHQVTNLLKVKIGEDELVKDKEYTYDISNKKLIINKATLDEKKGKIVITPYVREYTPGENVDSITSIEDIGMDAILGITFDDLGIEILPTTAKNKNFSIKSDSNLISIDSSSKTIKPSSKEGGYADIIITAEDGKFESKTKIAVPTMDKIHVLAQNKDYVGITEANRGISGLVILPRKYNGKLIDAGEEDNFKNLEFVTELYVPDAITYLGGIFSNCNNLSKVTLSNGLETIGFSDNMMFDFCPNLKTIKFPKSIIDCDADFEHSSFETIYIDSEYLINDIETGSYRFQPSALCCAKQLYIHKDIKLTEESTYINNNFKKADETLRGEYYLYVPNDNKYEYELDEESSECTFKFSDKTYYSGVVDVPKTYEEKGKTYDVAEINGTNNKKYGITSIKLNDGLKIIGQSAFYGTSIESLDIPDSVETINDDAFYRCANLKSINIPINVTQIDTNVFEDCDLLTEVYVDSRTIANDETNDSYLYSNCKFIHVNSDIDIGSDSFISRNYELQESNVNGYDVYKNKQIEIDDIVSSNDPISLNISVTHGCGYVCGDVIIPEKMYLTDESGTEYELTVKEIADDAFNEDKAEYASSFIIPNSVEKIGEDVFKDLERCKSIKIGANVNEIGSGSFDNSVPKIIIDSPTVANFKDSEFYDYDHDLIYIKKGIEIDDDADIRDNYELMSNSDMPEYNLWSKKTSLE